MKEQTEIIQFYKKHFATSQEFKNSICATIDKYNNAFTVHQFELAQYELQKLHDAFGTIDPEKLANYIYQ